MSFRDDLESAVKKIFAESWSERAGQVVPDSEDVGLENDAVKLKGTMLYADMSASTKLVDDYPAHFAAEIYKAYLHCAAKVVRARGGEITAYDGDRIMAVFIGNSKNSSAAKAALNINWCVKNIINSAIKAQYPKRNYTVRQTVGVDTSDLFVARTGIRGSNDLVWVGRAANYAAKLTDLSDDYPSWITSAVYDNMKDSSKFRESDKKPMWEERVWKTMGGMKIYRSNWTWSL